MHFGVTVWGNITESKKKIAFQQKIIGFLKGVTKSVPCRELFNEFNILHFVSIHVCFHPSPPHC
jgi:hypothetical protein